MVDKSELSVGGILLLRVETFDVSHPKLTILIISLLFLGCLGLVIVLFHDNSVTFESSDRRWYDQETLTRDFDEVILSFAKYRVGCFARNAKLVRTTPKDLTDIFAWPNYFLKPKWHVEFKDTSALPYINGLPDCQAGLNKDPSAANAMLEAERKKILLELSSSRWQRVFDK